MSTVTIFSDIEVNVDDVLSELDSDVLVEELESRNIDLTNTGMSNDYYMLKKVFYSKDDLYRHLCDICETSYHEPIDSLLQNLKNRLV